MQRQNPALRLRIIIPVFNDWASLSILLERLAALAQSSSLNITVSAVDDGSTLSAAEIFAGTPAFEALEGVEIIRLAVNVGHQRAIATGLCVASQDAGFDALLVMDADGQDPPEDIPALLQRAAGKAEFAVVAARRKRPENAVFKIFYRIYKGVFTLASGKSINFGNFWLFSPGYVQRLVMLADLWNSLPATVLRSRLPIEEVLLDRGARYAGESKMNFIALILHGMSGVSVYAETILVRLLLATVALLALSALAMTGTILLRFFLHSPPAPGWLTLLAFAVIVVLLQVLFTTLISLVTLLYSRVQRLAIPIREYRHYVQERTQVSPVHQRIEPVAH